MQLKLFTEYYRPTPHIMGIGINDALIK